MTTYSLSVCEDLISQYADKGTIRTIEEGTLGLGTVVCEQEGYKTAVIQEVFVNHWTSTHTIRFYKKTPKKYQDFNVNNFV